jgi:putative thioredoxin
MDVTDQTFQEEVLTRSATVPVVVDLWAPWCGPCKTLGPMLEKAVADTDGAVALAKVNVDDNPRVAQTFAVQSIPAVFAIHNGQVVDQFIGAVPEAQVTAFVQRLAPAPSEADTLVAAGDEGSLRKALELEPDHAGAIEALARLLVDRNEAAEALALMERVPETEATRALAAEARLREAGVDVSGTDGGEGIEGKLDELLERVRDDDAARQEFVDLLETMGADDPRTNEYRRALAARLF